MEISLYIASALLGIWFRYNLGMGEACKVIGVSLSNSGSDTGFQDAITPPINTNITLIVWLAIAGVLGFSVYEFGWSAFGISLATFFVVSTVVGVIAIPEPESKHYVTRIYRSMVNRYADFEKKGDSVRANAMKDLIGRMEGKYGNTLTG